MSTRHTALILVGHGSTKSGASSRAVYDHADALAGHPEVDARFDEIGCAFWKEEPFLHEALRTVAAHDVIAVPMFMAEGYFTREVVPREMGAPEARPGEQRRVGEQRLVFTEPIGARTEMRQALEDCATTALGDVAASDTALVVVGHGTPRNPNSAKTVYERVEELDSGGRFLSVHATFIDQEPLATKFWSSHPDIAEHVVVVPYFAADGPHPRVDVPEALALDLDGPGTTTVGGRTVHYATPVGLDPRIADVVGALANDALERFDTVETENAPELSRARDAFLERAREGSTTFGELRIEAAPHGWEVRHVDDVGRNPPELRTTVDDALEVARSTTDGAHRPLRSRRDLGAGWLLQLADDEDLVAALEHFYPGSLLGAWERERGELPIVDFTRKAGRQTGIYASTASAGSDAVDASVETWCHDRCVRAPHWHGESESGALPCREPCGFVLRALRNG